MFERAFTAATNAYVRALGRSMRMRWAFVAVFVAALAATGWVYQMVPGAFVPEEDQGYFMVQVQAPAGASLEYTGNIAKQAEKIILADPDVMALFSVMGFSFGGAASNSGIMFVRLKEFKDREGDEHAVQAVLGRLSGPLFGIPGAIVVGFTPPAIPGLSRFGGFEFQVLDQTGTDITNLAQATQAIAAAGNQSPKLRGLLTTFTANDPQLQVTIDRQRALAVGLPLSEITSAMQIFLGSQYVNDFEFNNRAYRVYVQADQRFRASPQALRQLYARTNGGEMVPLEQVVEMKEVTAPQVINHFNLFRSATINGSAAAGVSSGEALQEMERLAAANLPEGMGFAWSGISLEETKAGRQSFLIFGLALLLVYLTLAAQYESLVLPFIVLLGVPLAVLGALGAQWSQGALQRRLLPGRARHARRPRRQERNPDRRVRRAASGARAVDRRRGDRSLPSEVAADPDDVAGVHPRCSAARVRDRSWTSGQTFGGNDGRRGHARVHFFESGLHPHPLCDGADNARRHGASV